MTLPYDLGEGWHVCWDGSTVFLSAIKKAGGALNLTTKGMRRDDIDNIAASRCWYCAWAFVDDFSFKPTVEERAKSSGVMRGIVAMAKKSLTADEPREIKKFDEWDE